MSKRTTEKLILAAEKLVATAGYKHIKASDVVQLAGVKNSSAINYHFGGMDELLESVSMHRSKEFSGYRNTALAEIKMLKKDLDLQDWLFILFSPMAIVIELNAPESYHCAFLAQMQISDHRAPIDYIQDEIHKSALLAMEGAYKCMISSIGHKAAEQASVIGSDSSVAVFAMEEKRVNLLVANQDPDNPVNVRQRMGRRLLEFIEYCMSGVLKKQYEPIDRDYYIAIYELMMSHLKEKSSI